MSRIDDILEKIDDNAQVLVDIPSHKEETIRCKALLVKKESPLFELVFLPNTWVADDLRLGANCSMIIDHQGSSINLIARLESIVNNRRILFTGKEPVSPESLRDYFRVSTNVPIEASYIAGPKEIHAQTWKMVGTTIDISGSGVLAMFAEKPQSNHRIQLVITIPNQEAPAVCLANVIRCYRLRQNRYQVAFHFENISTKTRDQVVSFCLQEERRQLRENVRTV